MKSKSGVQLITSFSLGWKIPFLATYCLDNLDDLIQSGFWVIAEITLANLRKPVHVVITILVPPDPYESRNCGK